MMTDTRSSALWKRVEQLKRWEESDTNRQSPNPKQASRIKFSSGIVFLAACTAGDKEEVQRLLKMGADINTANVDGLTALHQACIDDNLDMVEFLVSRGADVNRGDNEGWTPLHATASCGFLSIARYLLENGADVGAVNYDGELPVDIAESDTMEELLQKIIDEKGIDCEMSRNAEVNILMTDAKLWAENGYVEVHDPKTGGTPLHVAAAKGYVDVAQTLLEACNVDPDSVDYEGWTPLHAAALWGQKEAATVLLKHGADPDFKNYSGQTCLDLADPTISGWLAEACVKAPKRIRNNNNNNNKRKRSPPSHDVKRVELQITDQKEENNISKDTNCTSPEIIKMTDTKPPKVAPSSPENNSTDPSDDTNNDESPSWRRSASLRTRQNDASRDKNATTNNTSAQDNDTILRRTHSFENDKTFYQRYRDVTARIKASSCPSLPPLPQSTLEAIGHRKQTRNNQEATNNTNENTNDDVQLRNNSERRERDTNTWNSPSNTTGTTQTTVRSATESADAQNNASASPSATTPTKLSPGNIFKNFFKSFVPPVRDEESETQRKAHAKRVRETRRSTQGVTLDEIKSAEQLVKKKAGNGAAPLDSATSTSVKKTEPEQNATISVNSKNDGAARGGCGASDVAVTVALASATATIAASTSERRPSWRLRLDPANKFELEDAARAPSPKPVSAPAVAADATVTLPLRRAPPPAASTANTTTTVKAPTTLPKDEKEEEKDRETSECKSPPGGSSASTQAALNVIQRRRRPKRRSTGVGHIDMDDIVNDRGGGGEGDSEGEMLQSGSERTTEGDSGSTEERDYKALYEASSAEVRRLRELLISSEQQLRDARSSISRLTQMTQSSLSETEKREKRAMERKLSEMEEELKQLQKLKAENERLRAENRALTRVVSKLTNSAGK